MFYLPAGLIYRSLSRSKLNSVDGASRGATTAAFVITARKSCAGADVAPSTWPPVWSGYVPVSPTPRRCRSERFQVSEPPVKTATR